MSNFPQILLVDKWDVFSTPALWIAYWAALDGSRKGAGVPWWNLVVALPTICLAHIGGKWSLGLQTWVANAILAWIFFVHSVLDVALLLVLSQSLSDARASPMYISPDFSLLPAVLVCLLLAPTTMNWVNGCGVVHHGQTSVSVLILLVFVGVPLSLYSTTRAHGGAHVASQAHTFTVLVLISILYGLPTRVCKEGSWSSYIAGLGMKCVSVGALFFAFYMGQQSVASRTGFLTPVRKLDWYHLRLSTNPDLLSTDQAVDSAPHLPLDNRWWTEQNEWWKVLFSVFARTSLLLSAGYWFARYHRTLRTLHSYGEISQAHIRKGVHELRLLSAISAVTIAVVAVSKEQDYNR